jgi:3-hydroxyacyl-CoA dehydrogenase
MKIKKVAVLGGNGAMGRNIAAIFASFGHCEVYIVSRSLLKSKDAMGKAIQSVRADSIRKRLIPATYENFSQILPECDLIFESVSENFEVKNQTFEMIQPYLKKNQIFASGTSGFSVNKLSQFFRKELRSKFIGIHFFNPPYKLSFCELIPSKYNSLNDVLKIKAYLENTLYRSVVISRDEPAFIGNRIGFFFINLCMQYAKRYASKGGVNYIDSLIGGFTGREMAPLRTADYVGLDVHQAIVDNIMNYEDKEDYERESFMLPHYVTELIRSDFLGAKRGAGLYRRSSGGQEEIYDISTNRFLKNQCYLTIEMENYLDLISQGRYGEYANLLINSKDLDAQIIVELLLKYAIYGITVSLKVGKTIHDGDVAMASGFNWIPPLALVEIFGGREFFLQLAEERLGKEYLQQSKILAVKEKIVPSKYDFRKFIKAKV